LDLPMFHSTANYAYDAKNHTKSENGAAKRTGFI
jgi:hypothetical protein